MPGRKQIAGLIPWVAVRVVLKTDFLSKPGHSNKLDEYECCCSRIASVKIKIDFNRGIPLATSATNGLRHQPCRSDCQRLR